MRTGKPKTLRRSVRCRQVRAAAGDDDFAEHVIARHVLDDFRFGHAEHLEHARHDDRAQLRGRHVFACGARRAFAP